MDELSEWLEKWNQYRFLFAPSLAKKTWRNTILEGQKHKVAHVVQFGVISYNNYINV